MSRDIHPDKQFDHAPNRVFVFGSNRGGYHGGGAAFFATSHCGAEWGVGEGLTGRSYALPTKDERIKTLPMSAVREHVDKFLTFAKARPDLSFFVTKIGCGLAGFTEEQIAPLFAHAPPNCELPTGWP